MEVRVSQRKVFDVELSQDEVDRVTLNTISRVIDFPTDAYITTIKKGKDNVEMLCVDEEVHTSHRFDIRHEIRIPTESDRAIIELIRKIKYREWEEKK